MKDDLQAGQGLAGLEQVESDGEAAVAYHKIRSVYPFLTADEVRGGRFDVEGLLSHQSVSDLLGEMIKISCSSSDKFLESLKEHVDSKEKTRGRNQEAGSTMTPMRPSFRRC